MTTTTKKTQTAEHTIAEFTSALRSTWRVVRRELADGDDVYALTLGKRDLSTWTRETVPEAIRLAAMQAADETLAELLMSGLVGHLCERCEVGFEHRSELLRHTRDAECHDTHPCEEPTCPACSCPDCRIAGRATGSSPSGDNPCATCGGTAFVRGSRARAEVAAAVEHVHGSDAEGLRVVLAARASTPADEGIAAAKADDEARELGTLDPGPASDPQTDRVETFSVLRLDNSETGLAAFVGFDGDFENSGSGAWVVAESDSPDADVLYSHADRAAALAWALSHVEGK